MKVWMKKKRGRFKTDCLQRERERERVEKEQHKRSGSPDKRSHAVNIQHSQQKHMPHTDHHPTDTQQF